MKKRYPSCILATCCLPWNGDGTLAEEVFRREIRNLRDNLTRHLYLFGTAGEGHAVTEKQYEQIIRIFHEETLQPDTHPMIGVIHLSLGTIIERIDRAYDLGFHAFQISLPSWGALNDAELMTFF
ncbi:MAG: dihydrodipicolinate synthase family protein, partial [Verrucomicrobiota bacterium]